MTQRSRGIDKFLREQQTRVGEYREFAPSADLREVVACNWVSVVHHGKFRVRTPIIPDGCSDIMTCDAQAPRVVGPDTVMRWVALPEGSVITGLRLRPGALRAVLRCSAATLLDQQASLSDFGAAPPGFLERLESADDLAGRHAALEAWVRRALVALSPEDRAILCACRVLSSDPQLEIAALARRLGWHARQVHRRFIDACGYGPKHLQRIMRVQMALRAAHDAPVLRLSQIAADAGFADQAHMTREFRALTGFTPASYFAAYQPEVGAWLSADRSP